MPSANRTKKPGRRPSGLADQVFETAEDALDAARGYLASEEGRRLRRKAATAVILAAPILSELPIFRRTPIGRLIRTAAVGTLIVRGAEWIRDWEPGPGARAATATHGQSGFPAR